MRRLIQHIAVVAIVCYLSGCGAKQESDKAKIHWGYTTQNFLKAIPVSEESSRNFIDLAEKEGYSWIELRDPNASLSREECQNIAAYAELKGIDVVYSVQRGLLAPDFKRVIQKGLENARLFKGARLLRVLALRDKHPLGWTEMEFKDAIDMANQASGLATSANFRLMIENADVILDGKAHGCFGMAQLLDTVAQATELQLDCANIFTGPIEVGSKEAELFIRKHAARISYVHLKSAEQMVAQPVLGDNPLKLEKILNILTENKTRLYVAVELSSDSDSIEVINKNMRQSLNWLKKNGLFER